MGEPKIVVAGETMTPLGIEVNAYVCRDCYTGDLGPDRGMVGFRMIAHLIKIHKLEKADACRILLNAKAEE